MRVPLRKTTLRAGGRKGAAKVPAPPKSPKGADDRRKGRLTVTKALSGDDERTRSVASFRRRMQRLTGKGSSEPKEKIAREVIVPETITIQELANRMAERGVDVIRLLMKQGAMHKITDVIDADTTSKLWFAGNSKRNIGAITVSQLRSVGDIRRVKKACSSRCRL